ncbi:MAG: 2-oxoacid:acceptor oxidoreductase family protein [archaeon]
MQTTSILIAGLGGQGVIVAGSVLSCALVLAGSDVKTSCEKGIAQRSSPVLCHVRFGDRVYSPLAVNADYLLLLSPVCAADHYLSPETRIIKCSCRVPYPNMYLLGMLSRLLAPTHAMWARAMESCIPGSFEASLACFRDGSQNS